MCAEIFVKSAWAPWRIARGSPRGKTADRGAAARARTTTIPPVVRRSRVRLFRKVPCVTRVAPFHRLRATPSDARWTVRESRLNRKLADPYSLRGDVCRTREAASAVSPTVNFKAWKVTLKRDCCATDTTSSARHLKSCDHSSSESGVSNARIRAINTIASSIVRHFFANGEFRFLANYVTTNDAICRW